MAKRFKDVAPFFVMSNPGGRIVYVKSGDYFRSQGGLRETWGKAWAPIEAKSIDDARIIGERMIKEGSLPVKARH